MFTPIPEDITNKAREDKVYMIEFKVVDINKDKPKGNKSAYVGKYQDLHLMVMDYDKREQNIVNFEGEEVRVDP
ncbi:MAG: hypothetical protein N3D76_08230 [Geminocystis sp.]|nr:hypothetical protein [Geminocystis sp.]